MLKVLIKLKPTCFTFYKRCPSVLNVSTATCVVDRTSVDIINSECVNCPVLSRPAEQAAGAYLVTAWRENSDFWEVKPSGDSLFTVG